MFTAETLKAAHSKVKSGADFPNYVKEIKTLGVKSYTTYVSDGHTTFAGTDNSHVAWEAKYPSKQIAAESNAESFIQRLKAHQQGQTDYFTFCDDCAANGVEKWIVDLEKMTCIYYDKAGNQLLVEQVPQA
jgi:uncharacterized protein YbcV (DUF1398 family)